ncbi:MAG: MIP family channel protein [Acidimicrobiaceae bacterium]|nr:MAG: MIP family channel protein [Acidimicrobiaceae bacterium]
MQQNNGRILAAELVGTCVLVLGGPGTAILAPGVGLLGIALAFGLSLMIMAYVIGPVSGCHINPAVTLGLLIARKIDGAHATFAVIGQLVGGIVGATIIYGVANGRPEFERGQFAANLWSGDYFGLGATIVVEVVLTALLVVVVLSTTGRRFATGMGGLVVGFTLTLIHLISIPVDNTADPDTGAPEQLWAFIVFPLLGAVVGVIVWLVIDDTSVEATMLGEVPGIVEARDALDRAADEAVGSVEDAVD